MKPLTLSDFNYQLPEQLIAQQPLPERSASRLLVRLSQGTLQHRQFADLPHILQPGTHLLYNDTRVIPGRLLAKTQHGGRVELMLLKQLNFGENRWQALGRPFRKLKVGTELELGGACYATVRKQESQQPQPTIEVTFNLESADFHGWMENHGYIPLPPYIARQQPAIAPLSLDRDRYQTVYAEASGSVAAPTAGLHFSPDLWQQLEACGIIPVPLTLHVGGGTFLPVKTHELAQHAMHTEQYRISRASWTKIEQAHKKGLPLVAVGTTSLRCLESMMRRAQEEDIAELLDCWLETDLFLYPRHRQELILPWGLTGLITNFHQPESSLLMLVAALIGYEAMQKLYEEAIEHRYRFFSYGDASLLYLNRSQG